MDSSTEDILNVPEKVKAFGKEYEIKRLTLGPLIRASEYIAPLGYVMRAFVGGKMDMEHLDIGEMIAQTLTVAGQPALGLISIITEEPPEWLEDKDPIEAFELLAPFIEKNVRYFFAPGNKERIEAAFNRIKKAVQSESGKSATPSSPVDTAR